MIEISVEELKRRRDAGDDLVVLDVRDDDELVTARIDRVLHIPMPEVPQRTSEIPRNREIVVMCHHGGRSARVANFLTNNGYDRVANLEGGIDAWSERIDASVPRY